MDGLNAGHLGKNEIDIAGAKHSEHVLPRRHGGSSQVQTPCMICRLSKLSWLGRQTPERRRHRGHRMLPRKTPDKPQAGPGPPGGGPTDCTGQRQ